MTLVAVCAIQLAHDGKAYANPNCGKLIRQATMGAAQEESFPA